MEKRYNGRHTCTMRTIFQDHSKLDSDTVVEAIRPLVETVSSIRVKSKLRKFNYTINYRKAWLAKQKSIAKVFGGWKDSYKALLCWLSGMVQKMPDSIVQIKTRPLYNGSEEANSVKILHRGVKHCKPLVQVYFWLLLHKTGTRTLCLSFLPWWRGRHLMCGTSFSRICECMLLEETAAVNHSKGDWQPPKSWWMFCIRHIGSNFLRALKVLHLQKFVVNIGYSGTVEEYNINYKRLEERGKAYARWCDAMDLDTRYWHLTRDIDGAI
ncbi:hypothetical protein Ahy_A07g034642 isoform A [Arachis hypogaea]|uniref:Uncharacterized protein n=1 Tax=Arachis hypogaea TaxID=3818 RepID=A0A445CCQ6_ARAHY|nr:hypothetical protein Ahy_A07g034642 isoform A [Arachis hypogaea]